MKKSIVIDLLDIDQKTGRHWLEIGREQHLEQRHREIYARHRARYLSQLAARRASETENNE
jgi:hypothetical protein